MRNHRQGGCFRALHHEHNNHLYRQFDNNLCLIFFLSMKKLFLLLLTVMTLSLCALYQTRTVQELVDAENDEPLIGVSVSAGSGRRCRYRCRLYHFSLKIPESVTHLKISYVGFKTQEVKVSHRRHADSSAYRIEPPQRGHLPFAYGKSTRAAFTGSAAVVSSAEIENSQVSNPLNAIKGKVPAFRWQTRRVLPVTTTPASMSAVSHRSPQERRRSLFSTVLPSPERCRLSIQTI